MVLPSIKPCKCGRQPERNRALRGFRFSLSCTCEGEEIMFLSRSQHWRVCIDNWNSRVTGEPFLHQARELSAPDASGVPVLDRLPTLLDSDPLRRQIIESGGHVGGPWGGSS